MKHCGLGARNLQLVTVIKTLKLRRKTMERVVYLLGAGFSAPLGLPVMDNFYLKSKDMYYENKNDYIHFNDVFETIKDMSFILNYYKSDLFNIEEILSILEMSKILQPKISEDDQFKKVFLKYICDVIKYYTPKLGKPNFDPSNWENNIFGNHKWNCYGHFVSSLFNLKLIAYMAEDAGRRKKESLKLRWIRIQIINITLLPLIMIWFLKISVVL
jgi:hypothetical protein